MRAALLLAILLAELGLGPAPSRLVAPPPAEDDAAWRAGHADGRALVRERSGDTRPPADPGTRAILPAPPAVPRPACATARLAPEVPAAPLLVLAIRGARSPPRA